MSAFLLFWVKIIGRLTVLKRLVDSRALRMMSKLLPMAMMPPTPLKLLASPVARVVKVFSVETLLFAAAPVPVLVSPPVVVVPVAVPVVLFVVTSCAALAGLRMEPRLERSR